MIKQPSDGSRPSVTYDISCDTHSDCFHGTEEIFRDVDDTLEDDRLRRVLRQELDRQTEKLLRSVVREAVQEELAQVPRRASRAWHTMRYSLSSQATVHKALTPQPKSHVVGNPKESPMTSQESPGMSHKTSHKNFDSQLRAATKSSRDSVITLTEGILLAGLWRDSKRRPRKMWAWWTSLQEPEREPTCLTRIVASSIFSSVCLMVIIANGAFACAATNRASETNDVEPLYAHVDLAFTLFYVVELVLKLAVHRLYFFCNNHMSWNLFDFILVCFSVYDWALASSGGSPAFLRTMRVLKASKALRVFRMIRLLDNLRLLLNSLIGSIGSLVWSMVMMAMIMYLFALIFVQAKITYLVDGNVASEDEEANLNKHFGSVQQAMLGMLFTAIGGSDSRVPYDVISVSGPMSSILYLFSMTFIQVSVMNILTAVFVENSMQLAQPDREQKAAMVRDDFKRQRDEIEKLIDKMDVDDNGEISMDEFIESMTNNEHGSTDYFEALGLEPCDAELFVSLLLDKKGSETVTKHELVDACMDLVNGGRLSLFVSSINNQVNMVYEAQLCQAEQLAKFEKLLHGSKDRIHVNDCLVV